MRYSSKIILQYSSEIDDGEFINTVDNRQPISEDYINIERERLSHFINHIPKSGATFVYKQLVYLLHSTIPLPKKLSIKDVRIAQERFNESLEGDFFIEECGDFPVDLTGDTDAYTPPHFCNRGFIGYDKILPYWIDGRGVRQHCALQMSERPWNERVENAYTIIREPFSHTLSQFFHCTESSIRARTNNTSSMTLDEWLVAYADVLQEGIDEETMNDKIRKNSHRFNCYNPIESESAITGFPNVPEDYLYPYPNTAELHRDEETKALDIKLFGDLKRKFKIVGDNSRMIKTVCAIFIDFTKGKYIPQVCDCSDHNKINHTGVACLRDLYKSPINGSCSIKFGSTATKRVSHGVKHHGDSYFDELTPTQLKLLSKLRRNDQVLYNISRAVFDEQITEMETRYGIKVCDDWNTHQ